MGTAVGATRSPVYRAAVGSRPPRQPPGEPGSCPPARASPRLRFAPPWALLSRPFGAVGAVAPRGGMQTFLSAPSGLWVPWLHCAACGRASYAPCGAVGAVALRDGTWTPFSRPCGAVGAVPSQLAREPLPPAVGPAPLPPPVRTHSREGGIRCPRTAQDIASRCVPLRTLPGFFPVRRSHAVCSCRHG